MMNYTDEQLKLIEDYASKFLSITEIAVLVDVDEDELRDRISLKKSDASKHYNRGKLNKIIELRSMEIELAKLGSTVAIELVNKYIENQKNDE
jgi:predicted DNA-binding protein YlxM (UPF0122 family)